MEGYLQRSSEKSKGMQVQKMGEFQKNCRGSIIQGQYMGDVFLNSCYTPTNKEKSTSRWQTTDYQSSNSKYGTVNLGSPKNKNTPSKFSYNIYQSSSVFNSENMENYELQHMPTNEKLSRAQNFNIQANRSISPINPIQHHLQKSRQRFSNSSPTKKSPKPRLSIYDFSPTFKDERVSPKYSFTSTFPSTPKKLSQGTSQFYKITSTKQYKNQVNVISEAKERFSLTVPTFGRNSIGDIGQSLQPKLNDFIIGQCKGEGRFGKVYMAIHRKTGFICAMKKIKKESVKSILEQFIQEVKIQLYFNHPKLVKIYGYFSDFEYFYMLLQYMEEGSLYSLMKKNRKLDESQVSQKLEQICSGIKEMHSQNVVHRDLKPQNIVLSHGVCKICDFGWAALCQGRRQTYCGTLDYVCPQIIEGQAYDSSVDVWCIGVMAYQMMCGKAPFFDISRKKTMQKIKQCKIDNYPSHLSKSAIAFIQMILQRNPDQRVGIQQLLDSHFLKGIKK